MLLFAECLMQLTPTICAGRHPITSREESRSYSCFALPIAGSDED